MLYLRDHFPSGTELEEKARWSAIDRDKRDKASSFRVDMALQEYNSAFNSQASKISDDYCQHMKC